MFSPSSLRSGRIFGYVFNAAVEQNLVGDSATMATNGDGNLNPDDQRNNDQENNANPQASGGMSEREIRVLELKLQLQNAKNEELRLRQEMPHEHRVENVVNEGRGRVYDPVANYVKLLKGSTGKCGKNPIEVVQFFETIDRHFVTYGVPVEAQSRVTLCLIEPELANHVYRKLDQVQILDYDRVKSTIFEELRVSPEILKKEFDSIKKQPNESFFQLSTKIARYLDYYLSSRNVEDFPTLINLLVADRLKDCLSPEIKAFILQQEGEGLFSPQEIAQKADVFLGSRQNVNSERNGNRTFGGNNNGPFQKNFNQGNFRVPPRCYQCGSSFHIAKFCDKGPKFGSNDNSNNNRDSGSKNNEENRKISKVKVEEMVMFEKEDVSGEEGPFWQIREGNEWQIEDVDDREIMVASGIHELCMLLDTGCDQTVVQENCLGEQEKPVVGEVILQGAFRGSKIKAPLKRLSVRLKDSSEMDEIEMLCAITPELNGDGLLSLADYESLCEAQKEKGPGFASYMRGVINRAEKKKAINKKEVVNTGKAREKVTRDSLVYNEDEEKEGSEQKKGSGEKTRGSFACREGVGVDTDQQRGEKSETDAIGREKTDVGSSVGEICEEAVKQNKEIGEQSDSELLKLQQASDVSLEGAFEEAKKGNSEYCLIEGFLSHKRMLRDKTVTQLVLPQCRRERILNLAHNAVFSSHNAFERTLKRVKLSFFWPKVKRDCRRFCAECLGCALRCKRTKDDQRTRVSDKVSLVSWSPKTINREGDLTGFQQVGIPGVIAVFSESQHMMNLNIVLKELEDNEWTGNVTKGTFVKKKVRYRGLGVGSQAVSLDPEKLVAIRDSGTLSVGACLSQFDEAGLERPVAYASQKLSATQSKMPAIHREAYAIVFGLRKYEEWIYGAGITVISDHNPLSYLTNASPQSSKLQRWALAMQSYDITVQHRAGSAISHVDALSRLSTGEGSGEPRV